MAQAEAIKGRRGGVPRHADCADCIMGMFTDVDEWLLTGQLGFGLCGTHWRSLLFDAEQPSLPALGTSRGAPHLMALFSTE